MSSEITTVKVDPESFDIVTLSTQYPLAVMFAKSTSPNYPTAVELSKLASVYGERLIGKTTVHLAAFSNERSQLSRALAVLQLVQGLKSTQMFAGGILMRDYWKMEQTISCFMQSQNCSDWRAHCLINIESPFAEDKLLDQADLSRTMAWIPGNESNRYIYPCRFVYGQSSFAFTLYREHPASPEDQIQALAVKKGCAWCPNFNASEFREVKQIPHK